MSTSISRVRNIFCIWHIPLTFNCFVQLLVFVPVHSDAYACFVGVFFHGFFFFFLRGNSRKSWVTVVQESVQLICKCKGSTLKAARLENKAVKKGQRCSLYLSPRVNGFLNSTFYYFSIYNFLDTKYITNRSACIWCHEMIIRTSYWVSVKNCIKSF